MKISSRMMLIVFLSAVLLMGAGPARKRVLPSLNIQTGTVGLDEMKKSLSSRVALFSELIRQGNFAEAAKLIDGIDVSHLSEKQKGALYKMRALAKDKAGDTNGAFDDYTKLSKMRPHDQEVQNLLKSAELKLQIEKTIQPAQRKKLWQELGGIYEKQKKYFLAGEAYRQGGDLKSLARIKTSETTDRYNEKASAENAIIEKMRKEAEKLEEELKELEGGGGG